METGWGVSLNDVLVTVRVTGVSEDALKLKALDDS